ncbi:hypothetical protein F5884DRAFT_825552 [Xylogone sp. PMI_703]|nr:hypothetical protein F5884DRAFT_825552 [Xylogone sp. PMI_703]
MENDDDNTKSSLREIARCQCRRIIPLLLDIQESQIPQEKSLSFIEQLECLSPSNNPTQQTYLDKITFYRSSVRDCVFDRVSKYIHGLDLKLMWIDRHSIRQQTACQNAVCSHISCTQKREALQVMDLVYKLSNYPVAILGRPIKSRYELVILANILEGKLVTRNPDVRQSRLSRGITYEYWTRAWTFQENHRSRTKMTLLVRHSPYLESLKRQCRVFGDISGELSIKSVKFSEEATRICLAIQRNRVRTGETRKMINHVLQATGKYTILLDDSSPMYPSIIEDIEKRGVSNSWDRLAITANCCQYSIRLNTEGLRQQAYSLSLSMLVMSLLNSEILDNGSVKATHQAISQMTVSKFLGVQFFNGFHAPRAKKSLTFNKECRLISVKLMADGVMTEGHLWRLGRMIPTMKFTYQLPYLANYLENLSYSHISNQIKEYLDYESFDNHDFRFWDMTFPESYIRMMAMELVSAIDDKKTLKLGSLWEPLETDSSYSAIFIWDREGEINPSQRPSKAFVFTASRPKKPRSKQHDANDIDRHVSLEVRYAGLMSNRVPRLYVKRWVLGMCFFRGCPRMDVSFPWLPDLKAIDP